MDKLKQAELNSHQQRLVLWTERIRQCRASNLTVKQWCSQIGVTDKVYYYWMRKIKHEVIDSLPPPKLESLHHTQDSTTDFAQVLLPLQPLASAPAIAKEAAVTICAGGISVKVMDGTSEKMIKNILSAINEIC